VKTYRLEAGDDHVQKFAHENDPVKAVIELVWNTMFESPTVVLDARRGATVPRISHSSE
jgi:hypothetical protein